MPQDAQRVDLAEHGEAVTEGWSSMGPWVESITVQNVQSREMRCFTIALLSESNPKSTDGRQK